MLPERMRNVDVSVANKYFYQFESPDTMVYSEIEVFQMNKE